MNYQKIIQKILFAVVVFALVSCAAITSHTNNVLSAAMPADYVMSVFSDIPNSEVVINSSNRYELPAKISVVRSSENLGFKILQGDIVINDTILKPKLCNFFLLGSFYMLHNPDLRFTYGNYVLIDSLGNVRTYRSPKFFHNSRLAEKLFKRHEKCDFNLLITLPYASLFHLNPKNETTRNLAGFIGLGFGTEYFYRNNKSLQLRGDGIINSIIPFFPTTLDKNEICFAFNVNLTDNFHIGRFQFGYGLNFARNGFDFLGYYEIAENGEDWIWIRGKRNINNMLGLALSTHYRFTNRFHLGVIYRPSFFELSNFNRMYEHTISLDLLWKTHL